MNISPAFGLYCMEQDGLLDTVEGKYHKALNLINQEGYSVEEAIEIAELDIDLLSGFQIAELYNHNNTVV